MFPLSVVTLVREKLKNKVKIKGKEKINKLKIKFKNILKGNTKVPT